MREVLIDGVKYVPARKGPTAVIPFGEVIRTFREGLSWSLDKLAEKANVSRTYLWELETGQATDPSLRIAARLGKAMCVDLEYLASSLDVES